MASGDLAYCDPRNFLICVPWEAQPCCVSTCNGFEYYYEDGQGGCYCGSGDYCASGYIFFNQFNLGSGVFIDATGSYCCTAYSNGIGSYYWNPVYYSGTVLNCTGINLDINSTIVNNGYCCLVSNGAGSCFYNLNYCSLGFSFFNINSINYLSDGTGYYYIDLPPRNALDVCMSWDFSKATKSKYNFCTLDVSGDDVLLCLNNLNSYFYEINSTCESFICLYEANQNKSLFIEDSCAPFIYVRNLGPSNINLILSNKNNYINFKECQIFNKINFSGENFTLKEKESVIFSLNVSSDGSHYCSNVIYPFGFFYEFKDVDQINELGVYPVCCAFDVSNNKYFPTYLYSDVCNLPIQNESIVQTGYGFNYKKQLSFNENLKVECFSNLELSFKKEIVSGTCQVFCINKNFNINSLYGYNSFQGAICTNSIQIVDENGICVINDENLIYTKLISNNSCIKVIYDIDINNSRFYNLIYLDCNSGSNNYDLNIKKINNLNECTLYSRNNLINSGGLLVLKDSENAYVEINLDEYSSIRDLKNKNINRNNMYLPVLGNFYYNYCFELNKSNYIENKIQTGFWKSGQIQINNSGFCNCSMMICCSSSDYQQYKSKIYNVKLCNEDNRKSTTSIQDKSSFIISDDFYIPRTALECCFYFCDLEFRYNPVQCVLYRNNYYTIDNEILQIEFSVSGNSEIINFPKNAINYDKLKINTDFEIFDSLACSQLNINYSDFSFVKNYNDTNYIDYDIPLIQCCNLSGYEHPQILIKNKIKQTRQTNINLDINPIYSFVCDTFYGLNNFLLFVTSKLNSGLALDFIDCGTKLMCDYCYDSSEYNFFMMDLKSESDNSNLIKPSVSWTNICERIAFDENNTDLISYKNNTGNGYNYISPVIDCLHYSDQFSGSSSLICSEIIQSGLLNYIVTGFNYDGSSRDIVYLFDGSQNVTGCCFRITSGSHFLIDNNNYFINLQPSDLTGLMECRNININKNYQFTGIQPFFINSNYAMLDIKYPMLCNNLQLYCLNISEDPISGLFYYIYGVSAPINTAIKLNSPEFTSITQISWGDKNISQFRFDSKIGQIQKNSARINLDINNLIYENPYVLNTSCLQTICINMIGGL